MKNIRIPIRIKLQREVYFKCVDKIFYPAWSNALHGTWTKVAKIIWGNIFGNIVKYDKLR